MNKFYTLLGITAITCLSCFQKKLVDNKMDTSFHQVNARKNATDPNWKTYTAKTIDRLSNFNYSHDPETNKYGGWKVGNSKGTGFFRVEKQDSRWWIIDPEEESHLYIKVWLSTDRVVPRINTKLQKVNMVLIKIGWRKESDFLKAHGFNGTGAWSNVDLIRESEEPLVYTIIVNPMGAYKHQHIKKFGGKYEQAGWQGYRFDLAMVFDAEFDAFVEREFQKL